MISMVQSHPPMKPVIICELVVIDQVAARNSLKKGFYVSLKVERDTFDFQLFILRRWITNLMLLHSD